MKNKYIIKLYHYYLKKKYDNDKIVGIKESEKVLENKGNFFRHFFICDTIAIMLFKCYKYAKYSTKFHKIIDSLRKKPL